MQNVNELISKYENELNKILSQMDNVKKQIGQLNQTGVELTTMANVLTGKIEGLKELRGDVEQND